MEPEPAAAPKQGGSSPQPAPLSSLLPRAGGPMADLPVRDQSPAENFLKNNSPFNKNREIND